MNFPLSFGGKDTCWYKWLSFVDIYSFVIVVYGLFFPFLIALVLVLLAMVSSGLWVVCCYLSIYQHIIIGVVAVAIIVLVVVTLGLVPPTDLALLLLWEQNNAATSWVPMSYPWATRYATSKSWLCGSMPKLLTVQLKRRSEVVQKSFEVGFSYSPPGDGEKNGVLFRLS